MLNMQYVMIWLQITAVEKTKISSCLGVEIGKFITGSSVRTCGFSYSGTQAVFSTDVQMKATCEIFIIDVRNADSSLGEYACLAPSPVSNMSDLYSELQVLESGQSNFSSLMWNLRLLPNIGVADGSNPQLFETSLKIH